MVFVAVIFQDLGELLLCPVGFAAVAARGEKITVASFGDFDHRRGTARSRNPYRRKRFLQRFGPQIHVAQRKIAAFMGEWAVVGPGAHDEIGRFPELLSRIRRRDIVIKRLWAAAGSES